jgi:hypothetical protein
MKYLLAILFVNIFVFQVQAAVPGCNCVVFRLDDIQDYWLSNNQQTLINTFRNQSIPLTIGIIANFFGTDLTLVNTINSSLSDPAFHLEIADHGFNHEDFSTFTYDEQLSLLQSAVAKIKTVLPVDVNSFLAPFNNWNNDTVTALANVNITFMSAQLSTEPGPYPFSGQPIYHFPEGAETQLAGASSNFSVGVPANYTMDQIHSQIELYGYAVSTTFFNFHTLTFSYDASSRFLCSCWRPIC